MRRNNIKLKKTITIDSAGLDTCNKCSNTKKLLHLLSRIISCSSKVRDSLTKHLKKKIALITRFAAANLSV